MEYETEAFLYLIEDDSQIIVEKREWSLLKFREITLNFLVFEEPDIADDIGEYDLEKYASDMEEL